MYNDLTLFFLFAIFDFLVPPNNNTFSVCAVVAATTAGLLLLKTFVVGLKSAIKKV